MKTAGVKDPFAFGTSVEVVEVIADLEGVFLVLEMCVFFCEALRVMKRRVQTKKMSCL